MDGPGPITPAMGSRRVNQPQLLAVGLVRQAEREGGLA